MFGLIPALKLVRIETNPALQSQGVRSTGGKSAARFRATLTTAQIALSMALLVLAGWFAQSLANVTRVDVGFRADSLVGVLDRAGAQRLHAGALERVLRRASRRSSRRFPASRAVAHGRRDAARRQQLGQQRHGRGLSTRRPGENTDVSMNYVSPDFFRTVRDAARGGLGLRAPRAAPIARQVAIVNERFVETVRARR